MRPKLFDDIIANDARVAELKAQSVIGFKEAKSALALKRDYIRAAEHTLQWNKNKGATA